MGACITWIHHAVWNRMLTLSRIQRPECGLQFGKQAFVKTVESQVKTMGRRP